MKKSTPTSTPPATVGLDVGDRYSVYCLIAEDGEIAAEGKVRTREADLLQLTRLFPGARLVLEVGAHSPWMTRLLRTAGMEVIVANPRKLQLIGKNDRKTDRSDAETLARIGRYDPNLLFAVEHRSEQQQADLAVLRSRAALVSARTMLINQVRGSVKSYGARLRPCDGHSFHRLAAADIPEALNDALLPLVATIGSLTAQIAAMDKHIETLIASRYPAATALRQVQGVGPITSLAFVLTLSDPARFRRSRDVGPYLGLTPRLRQSGESRNELSITKAGDVLMRRLLVQCAHYILGPFAKDSNLRRWGRERIDRGGANTKKRVAVAVARKLAVLLHRLWVTGEVYEPLYRPGGAAA